MAAKAVRRATKPRSAKRRAVRRVTRKTARKAKKAAKPKAPKKAKATKPRAPKSKKAVRRTKVKKVKKPKKPKRVTKKMLTGSYRKVWNGTSTYTKGGLTKKDLMVNPKGRVVSKKKFQQGQRLKKHPGASGWMKAVAQARKELEIVGFCTINRGAQGVALYKRAMELKN